MKTYDRHSQRRPGLTSRTLTAGAVLACLAATSAIGAGAPRFEVTTLQAISGPSPFAAGCARTPVNQNISGYELEPAITVNPRNPRNVIATWKQDVGPGSTRSDLVGSSRDGGTTWTRRTVPGLSTCTGGTVDTATDPWISAGVDGTVYFTGLTADHGPARTPAIVASTSRDGGRTWPTPTTIASPRTGNDTQAITASPTIAGRGYATWGNFTFDFLSPSSISFALTEDGGATWSAPVLIDQAGPFQVDLAPKVLVLPDGALLAVFGRADFATGVGSLQAARSVDDGRTWLPAVEAGEKPVFEFHDENNDVLPQPGYPSAAVAPDGTVYVAFEDSRTTTSGAIGITTSRDGGRTWTTSALPDVPAFAFEPSITVDGKGTVGVTWYDLRNDRVGDGPLIADVWFASSNDHGKRWRQIHVAGPTDLRTSPNAAQNRVGEYQGLAPMRRGFAAAFTLAAPFAKDGPTDIFFARIGPRS